jgi:hypothetical protein
MKNIRENTDGSTELKDLKVRVSYDPAFNAFFLQVQEDTPTDATTDYAVDSSTNPNLETAVDDSNVVYGAGVKRIKVQGTPNVDLFKILNRLNARPEKESDEELEQTEDVADTSDDVLDSLDSGLKDMIKGLAKTKKDIVDETKDTNYYDVKRNNTFNKMVKDILEKGDGIIIVTGFDWANANLPEFKESIISEYLNSDRDVKDILKECTIILKEKSGKDIIISKLDQKVADALEDRLKNASGEVSYTKTKDNSFVVKKIKSNLSWNNIYKKIISPTGEENNGKRIEWSFRVKA